MKNKRKLNKKNLCILLSILILFIIFIVCIIKLVFWLIDNTKTDKIIKFVSEKVQIQEIDTKDAQIIENDDEKNSAYFEYIKMKLIDVDLNNLKKFNSDTVGWIKVEGTNINYPFVQTNDNNYYLTKSFDKKNNDAGWIFLDYRNNINNLYKNTIIYGHGRLNRTMFGSLKDTLNSSWQSNSNNYIIRLSTQNMNSIWQIFSIYKIPTTSDYLKISFATDEEFQNFIDLIKERTMFNFNTNVNINDKILTLSTCYNDDEKMVVHAKLIKFSNK
ncbi:MAG: class B sortase [Bacilli bacterium]